MDPIISNLKTSLPDSPSPETGEHSGKSGTSKFDKIRNQLKENTAKEAQPAGTEPTANPSADPGTDRMQRGQSVTLPDQVHRSLSASRYHLARLKERVESTPETGSISGLQSRLTSIERQYTQLDAATKTMPINANPQQWIALQQQVYSMNESIGVLSKMVTQAASGVKSVLQTQV